MAELLVVGLGGFIGSCMRFLVSKIANSFAISLPLGTLISNVTAGILIGFFIGIEQASSMEPKAKLFLTTGMLGGLSTFSTFSLETINLFKDGKHILAISNILLNLSLSLAGVVLGLFIAKLLFKKA